MWIKIRINYKSQRKCITVTDYKNNLINNNIDIYLSNEENGSRRSQGYLLRDAPGKRFYDTSGCIKS